MLSTLERTVHERRLFGRGARVLVAVSGGRDSMALLHALWELRARWDLSLEVATVDHGLRASSADEAAFVASRAETLGLSCQVLALGLGGLPRPRGEGLMAFAREKRLAALLALAQSRGADAVALGHHADDQIETILFRVVRGTGVHGLGGMPYARDGFVRPLLDVRRRDLERYVAARSIPFVDDPSNGDRRFARSRIRHDLLPLLARENPRVGEALLGLAREARGEIRHGRWREALDQQGLHASRAAWDAMAQAAANGGSRSFDLAGGRAEVRYGELVVAPREAPADPPGARLVAGPGELTFAGHTLKIREDLVTPSFEVTGGRAVFDVDCVPFPWQIRTWRAGDRMRPRGGAGSRKLSDLFIDARIPRASRASLPLVVGPDGTILFVPGLRPAELGRPSATSRRLVLLETSVAHPPESSR